MKHHVCTLCDNTYREDEGGIEGSFDYQEVAFCPWCYSCLVDMVHYHDLIQNDDEAPHTNH